MQTMFRSGTFSRSLPRPINRWTWESSMTTRAIKLLLALIGGLAAANILAAADPTEAAFRFLERRVESDPLDSVAQNRFSATCVLEMRKTGDLDFLNRAALAARASLHAVP